jgi:hypothetical protein
VTHWVRFNIELWGDLKFVHLKLFSFFCIYFQFSAFPVDATTLCLNAQFLNRSLKSVDSIRKSICLDTTFLLDLDTSESVSIEATTGSSSWRIKVFQWVLVFKLVGIYKRYYFLAGLRFGGLVACIFVYNLFIIE